MIRFLLLSWVFLGLTSSLALYGMATHSLGHSYSTTSPKSAPKREKEGLI